MSDPNALAAANAPPWFIAARKEIGFHEIGDNRGTERFIKLAHCGALGDPWCAIFCNAMLESTGFPGTRSAMARSFEHDQHFYKLAGPALGCITTFWRGIKAKGLGHVGFYAGEAGDYIATLGGNEGDQVRIEFMAAHGSTFGLSGYYWPKSAALPLIGKLLPQFASAAATGKVV